MKIKNVVVIGAGLMGAGIAQVSLMAGYKVTLVDIKDEYIEKGIKGIRKGLGYLEKKGKLGAGITAEKILTNLKSNTDTADAVKDADFIVEAVIENMKIKQSVFKICAVNAPEHTIIATNTSSMSITEIASTSGRENKCIGIHFFNPVPLMRLVEVIAGDKTEDETMDIAQKWAQSLPCRGKRYVPKVLKDRPGFIANRMIAPGFIYMNWAFEKAVKDNVSWAALDTATLKEGSPMGFLQLGDYVGHDTYLHINNYYSKTLSADFTPGPVYKKMVEENKLGRKTGQGFFDWSKGMPEIDRSKKSDLVTTEILDAIEANEGCRLLEEGVVESWAVIDDTMYAGFNRPGVMADAVEKYKEWTNLLEKIAKKIGKDYLNPCEYLKTGKFVNMK